MSLWDCFICACLKVFLETLTSLIKYTIYSFIQPCAALCMQVFVVTMNELGIAWQYLYKCGTDILDCIRDTWSSWKLCARSGHKYEGLRHGSDIEEGNDEFQEELEKLKDKFKKMQEDFKTKSFESQTRISQLEQQNTNMKYELDTERNKAQRTRMQLEEQIKSLTAKNQEVTTKLASEMSNKISADESSVENVSIKNRPMNVAEEYQLACSNEWLEAKEVLDNYAEKTSIQEHQSVMLLCNVIQVAEAKSKAFHEAFFGNFAKSLNNPLGLIIQPVSEGELVAQVQPESTDKELKIKTEVRNSVGDALRNNSDKINVDQLVQSILLEMSEAGRYTDTDKQQCLELWKQSHNADGVKNYVTKMARITWKMAIQRPQMTFNFKNQYYGDNYQELYWKSTQHTEAKYIVVYPMLNHKDQLMAKGKVYRMPIKEDKH